jgi:hypothetical protein
LFSLPLEGKVDFSDLPKKTDEGKTPYNLKRADNIRPCGFTANRSGLDRFAKYMI